MESFDWTNAEVVRVCDAFIKLNRKANDSDMTRRVRAVAEYYAANYSGDFAYMLDMRRAFDRWQSLTVAQARGTINCLLAEYRRRAEQAAAQIRKAAQQADPLPMPTTPARNWSNLQDGAARHGVDLREQSHNGADLRVADWETRGNPVAARDAELAADYPLDPVGAARVIAGIDPVNPHAPVTPKIANGTYTIVLDDTGDYRTLRIVDAPETMGKAPGTQIAQYLSGADNETNYTGFAFVSGDRFGVWGKFREDGKLSAALRALIAADKDQAAQFGEAYAIESGNCWHCGRKLTVPASLKRGLGPICAGKLGY